MITIVDSKILKKIGWDFQLTPTSQWFSRYQCLKQKYSIVTAVTKRM